MDQNELNKSNKIKIIIVTALIFLVAISGISYAYFTIQVVGNETASSMRLTTANLSLVYTDVQIVSGEDFYVVSSDSTNTVLLAKYNLLVGDVYNFSTGISTPISTSTNGYGLQSGTAKGYISRSNVQYIGVVPFSGTNYWDDSVCQYTGTSWGCTGTEGLKSEYANSGNPVGKTGTYASTKPYVYNSSMSNIAPSLNYGNGYGLAQNNGYTIAYYVEEYINSLGINGTGRLLTVEEVIDLGCTTGKGGNCDSAPAWFKNDLPSFWLGSAGNVSVVWRVFSGGDVYDTDFAYGLRLGVRPVIVISTSIGA